MSPPPWQARVAPLSATQRRTLADRLAAVDPRFDSDAPNQQLVAYVESVAGGQLDSDAVTSHLRRQLPRAMVPTVVVPVASLPRNANGKIDRNQLPAPRLEHARNEASTAPRNSTEEAIGEIWRQMLSLSSIDVFEDFFEAGGNSLLALRMAGAIQKRFDTDFSVARVFQNPTVAQLANALSGGGPPEFESRAVVPIQAQGSQSPLFCVHCVNGHVNQYFALAKALGPDQPVYGLQPPSRDGREAIPHDLTVLAARHIVEMRKVQPHGPYRVSGYSFGGMLAYEIAQQLNQAGEKIDLLLMFDTLLPRVEGTEQRAQRHRDQLKALDAGGRVRYVMRSALGNLNTLARVAWTFPKRLRESLPIRVYRRLGRPLPVALQAPFVRRNLNAAMYSYRAKPFAGRIVLFRASERNWMNTEFPQLGWDNMAREGLVIEDLPGSHGRMLEAPDVQGTAKVVRKHLNKNT